MEQEKSSIKKSRELLQQIEKCLENADREKEDLEREIGSEKDKNKRLKEQFQTSAGENEKLTNQIKNHLQENEQLKKTNKEYKEKKENMSKELKERKTEIEEHLKKSEKQLKENDRLKTHNRNLITDIKNYKAQIKSTSDQIQQQNSQLSMQFHSLQQNTQTIQEQNEQINGYNRMVQEQNQQIQDRDRQMEAFIKNVHDLERERNSLTLRTDKLMQERDDLTKSIHSLKDFLTTAELEETGMPRSYFKTTMDMADQAQATNQDPAKNDDNPGPTDDIKCNEDETRDPSTNNDNTVSIYNNALDEEESMEESNEEDYDTCEDEQEVQRNSVESVMMGNDYLKVVTCAQNVIQKYRQDNQQWHSDKVALDKKLKAGEETIDSLMSQVEQKENEIHHYKENVTRITKEMGAQINQQAKQLTEQRHKISDQEKQLQKKSKTIKELTEKNQKQEGDIKQMKQEIKYYKDHTDKQKRTINERESQLEQCGKQIKKLENEKGNLTLETQNRQQQIERQIQHLKYYKKTIQEHESTISQKNDYLEQRYQQITIQKQQIQQQDYQIQYRDGKLEEMGRKIQVLDQEKSELTLRLSKINRARPTRDNPNIADLSDMNRPTTLAEKYSELYDNEWTDAFEELTENQHTDEENTVKNLLDILKTVCTECLQATKPYREIIQNLKMVTVKVSTASMKQETCADTDGNTQDQSTQIDEVEQDLSEGSSCQEKIPCDENCVELSGRPDLPQNQENLTFDSMNSENIGVKLPPGFETNVYTGEAIAEVEVNVEFTAEQLKTVSDMKKLCASQLEEEKQISKIIAQKLAIERHVDIKDHEKLMSYIAKCAHLCWYMLIQEPPVVIGFVEQKEDTKFDKDTYKAYTKVGEYLDFVVWPPLYLHQGGPMLCKGTAQGKKKI